MTNIYYAINLISKYFISRNFVY